MCKVTVKVFPSTTITEDGKETCLLLVEEVGAASHIVVNFSEFVQELQSDPKALAAEAACCVGSAAIHLQYPPALADMMCQMNGFRPTYPCMYTSAGKAEYAVAKLAGNVATLPVNITEALEVDDEGMIAEMVDWLAKGSAAFAEYNALSPEERVAKYGPEFA